MYPGADHLCDGVADNDCDGVTDSNESDDDGDGLTECDGDCDDEGLPPHATWPAWVEAEVEDADASLVGGSGSSFNGAYLASPGDMNGDGIADIAIGDHGFDTDHEQAGAVHLLFGRTTGWSQDESILDHPYFVGGEDQHGIGSIDWIGDTNGDGLADLVIDPSRLATDGYHHDYLVFGATTGWTQSMSIDQVAARTTDTNSTEDDSFSTNAYVGDVDGDGLNDWMLGSTWNLSMAGQLFVVRGADAAGEVDMPDSAASWLYGGTEQKLWAGPLGDIDGDGIDDFTAARQVLDGWDTIDFFLGGEILPHDVFAADLADHTFVVDSECAIGAADLVGDINGDGVDDLAIEVLTDHGHQCAGVYLYWGGPGFPQDLDAASADVIIQPGRRAYTAGFVGDLNGDGIDDLLIRASPVGDDLPTDIYLVWGHTDPWPSTMEAGDADVHIAPTKPMTGIGTQRAGALPSSRPGHEYRGDVDGDGMDELFLHLWGSSYPYPNGVEGAGLVLVFAGRSC